MISISEFLMEHGISQWDAEWLESLIHDNHKAIIELTILLSEEEEGELLADLFKEILKNRTNSVLVRGKKTNYLLEFEDERFREVVKELDEIDEEFQPMHSPVYVFLDDGEIAIE